MFERGRLRPPESGGFVWKQTLEQDRPRVGALPWRRACEIVGEPCACRVCRAISLKSPCASPCTLRVGTCAKGMSARMSRKVLRRYARKNASSFKKLGEVVQDFLDDSPSTPHSSARWTRFGFFSHRNPERTCATFAESSRRNPTESQENRCLRQLPRLCAHIKAHGVTTRVKILAKLSPNTIAVESGRHH